MSQIGKHFKMGYCLHKRGSYFSFATYQEFSRGSFRIMEPYGRSTEYHTLMSEKHTYPLPNVCMCTRANTELYNHFLLGPCVFARESYFYWKLAQNQWGFQILTESFYNSDSLNIV